MIKINLSHDHESEGMKQAKDLLIKWFFRLNDIEVTNNLEEIEVTNK